MFTRLEIISEDKIGMGVKILDKVSEAGIDLLAVEISSKRACIKIQEIDENLKKLLKKSIYSIDEVTKVNDIDLLDYEKNERKLLAVIDSTDDGIMVVNDKYEIEVFNKYCQDIFGYYKDEVIGKDINEIMGSNTPMINLIKHGENYDNVELTIKGKTGKINYISSGRAIKNDAGETVGGVATIKEINKAIEFANVVASTKDGAFSGIISCSKSMERIKNIAAAVAKSSSTILLRGESGTGKEVFAKAIRNLSDRKDKKFVTINCAAIPESLMESELFGYEKGSFTGAMSCGKDGLFKEADSGTVFLDEIGELSLALQAKLLRVIQEGVIRKIGNNKEEEIDVRIIAATNKDLEAMIENSKFREDLYYRLNVIPIYIPPLRERLEDIPGLVTFFINKLNSKFNKTVKGADFEFIDSLMKYNWPGNIRELQNVMERAMILCNSSILTIDTLIIDLKNNSVDRFKNIENTGDIKLNEAVEICEKETILRALKNHESIRKAAKSLDVSHTTLINKIKKYNLKWKD